MVVSLLAGTAVAGSAGSAANTAPNPAVQSPLLFQEAGDSNDTVAFNDSIYDVKRGGTAPINLSLSGLDGVTVRIGGGQATCKLNATVTDGNGDGRIVLFFDTSKAGSGDGAALSMKADADSLTVKNETKLDGNLGGGMYGITVYNGTGENVSAIAHGGLNVQGDGTSDGTTTTDDGSSDETTTTTTPGDATTTTQSDGQPGFGLGVALVALAGVALLARRR
ncbi:DUF7827 domain-containing protein [Haladaptatus salinisoli]|uniref:DUF7827 domain-containing protein n=1 Tax=Haladaptatus salinisoli TaxID=2884876 RepID=UPI001D0AF14A|nr:PGF-CTERM sorting domain-containing protein [Haladaptatus salinisoli]